MKVPRPRRARYAWLLLAALASVAAAAPVVPGVGRAQAQDPPYTVTVTPTTDISDGKQLVVNVRTDPSNADPIYEAMAYVCRAGVSYLPGDLDRPSPEGRQTGPNCPPTGLSTSAQPNAVSSRTYKFAPTAEGENLFLRVGIGVVEWTDTQSGNPSRLACDDANPCVLLVQLKTNEGYLPYVFDLTFRSSDAVLTCGGAAPGALTSAGSDALQDAWIDWTLATCQGRGTGAWSSLALGEESAAVKRFAEGQLDIAYTALGYNAEAGFVGDVPAPRASVAIPIGVSATTLGLGNGYLDGDGRKLPFGRPSLTLDESLTLLTGGEFPFRDLGTDIGTRNPELAGGNLMISTATGLKVGAPAEAGVTPWVLTRHFDTLRPDLWKVPDRPIYPEAGQPRGVDTSFPLASPSYANIVSTLTGRPSLAKALGGLGPSEIGGIWMFTDLTTALAYDLAPAAIGNAAGDFVEPTNETMAAAVDTMQVTDSGMRVPDPGSTTGYPLTYVVYAMAPAQPLTDASGACRTESQQLLADWLTYVVRDGQASLPAGIAPLTPALQAEAEQKLQEIGKAPGVDCPVPPIDGPNGGPPPSASPSAAGVPVSSGASGSGGGAAVLGVDEGLLEQANAELALADDEDDPGFFGGALPSVLLGVGALFAVGWLTAVAARQTGARALPPGPEMTSLPPPPDEAGMA